MTHLATRFARLGALAASCAAAAVTVGCAASASPGYDAVFGDASRALLAQQHVDPAAPQRNADALPVVDGRSVREGMDRQVESFKAPPQPTVINIGLGGS